jgi:hypothetical protein
MGALAAVTAEITYRRGIAAVRKRLAQGLEGDGVGAGEAPVRQIEHCRGLRQSVEDGPQLPKTYHRRDVVGGEFLRALGDLQSDVVVVELGTAKLSPGGLCRKFGVGVLEEPAVVTRRWARRWNQHA